MVYHIEINHKLSVVDASGESIKKDILDLAITGVKNVKTSQLYSVEGNASFEEIELICKNLLADPITQEYSIFELGKDRETQNRGTGKSKAFSVEVWFKNGVTDTVGESVEKAVRDLGIRNIDRVKTGQKFVIQGDLSQSEIEKICRKLLANKVVQDYIIIKL